MFGVRVHPDTCVLGDFNEKNRDEKTWYDPILVNKKEKQLNLPVERGVFSQKFEEREKTELDILRHDLYLLSSRKFV